MFRQFNYQSDRSIVYVDGIAGGGGMYSEPNTIIKAAHIHVEGDPSKYTLFQVPQIYFPSYKLTTTASKQLFGWINASILTAFALLFYFMAPALCFM